MPPIVALFLTTFFVLWLLARDARNTTGTTYALWIPMTWATIISSRFVSEWFRVSMTSSNYMEGSPIDQPVFLVLILAAGWILYRRGVSIRHVAAVNVAVAVFLGYGFLSIMWSDFPWIAFKRWVKVVGHPMMVLVILTEPSPKEALHAVFRRLGFLLLPTSVLLIKVLPRPRTRLFGMDRPGVQHRCHHEQEYARRPVRHRRSLFCLEHPGQPKKPPRGTPAR